MDVRALKILMLGWEFPPHISGGLGTACEGLTKGLAARGVHIHFFMPHLFGDESANHLNIYDVTSGNAKYGFMSPEKSETQERITITRLEEILLYGIPSYLRPYMRPVSKVKHRKQSRETKNFERLHKNIPGVEIWEEEVAALSSEAHYGQSLFQEVQNYCRRTLRLASSIDFQIIHAHDWMTYPAGIALKRWSKKPLLLHVHSLESDRSGGFRNEFITEIERTSLQETDFIIAVSEYTRHRIVEDYGIDPDKIFVVHNGVTGHVQRRRGERKDSTNRVLFLGRVTFQKGPDYFVEAALKVLQVLPDTEFILAGSGDMLEPLRKRIEVAGFAKNFKMPGFLRGLAVDEAFDNADLYVMPSVSEPFGISALEALRHDVPIIVSRQSGVSEVIQHALKADFWDVDELADLMIGALKYPELRRDLLQMARKEVQELDWNKSAEKTISVYLDALSRFVTKGGS